MADQEEKRIIVKVAYNYFQEGKWDRALSEYLKLIAIDPMDFLVHNMMAEIHIRKDDKKKAVSEFLKAASLLSATNNIEKAIHAYKNIVKLEPDHQESIQKIETLLRARLIEVDDYVRRGSLKNALEICEKLSMRLPENNAVESKITEIEALIEKQESAAQNSALSVDSGVVAQHAAAKEHDDALKNEEVVKNLLAMADHYEKKQAWDEAVETYITVLRFQPANTLVQNKLKQLYRQVTQKDKSNEVWSRISDERQKSIEQAKSLAKNNPKTMDSSTSQLLDQAGRKNPAAEKGKSFEELEKLRVKAEEKLRLAVKDRRERDEQIASRGPVVSETLTAKDMEVDAERDQNIQVLLTQAQMYVQQNMLVESMRLAQNILELDPQNKEVRNVLKKIYDKKELG
ncbi:hypothetical protein K8S19_06700 [bacterium]|nr:hypothetical protein [bacterium]